MLDLIGPSAKEQGVTSLEQNKITPQEIQQNVSSFEQNIASTKLGDLR
jgi:hypothetical protein